MTGLMLERRTLGRLALAGAGLLAAPGWARATAVPPAGVIPFSVFRPEGRLGHHHVRFRRDGDRTVVDVDIRLQVDLGPVTLFRYTHRNREVWADDRLVSLDATTDDDGTAYRVTGRATGDGFQVEGSGGSFMAPADIMPSSYWHADTVNRDLLLHTQRGNLQHVETRPAGVETIEAGGRMIAARRYRMTGTLQVDAWYSEANQWVKLAFAARGSTIDYVLDPGSAGAPTVITG